MLSPQAATLTPAATLRIAAAILDDESDYCRTVAAGRAAVCELRGCCRDARLALSPAESKWLDRIEAELAGLPDSEDRLWSEMTDRFDGLFDPAAYGR
jgi:hypothetical protein